MLFEFPKANPISRKVLLPELLAKLLPTKLSAAFLNRLYLKRELMNSLEFLCAETNSEHLKCDTVVLLLAKSNVGVEMFFFFVLLFFSFFFLSSNSYFFLGPCLTGSQNIKTYESISPFLA